MSRPVRKGLHARRLWVYVALLAAGSAGCAVPAGAQRLEYTGAVQGASGDYIFTDRTTSIALSSGLAVTAGRVRVVVTLPLLYQNSTAVTYVGGVPVGTGGPDAGAVRDRQQGSTVPMGPRRAQRGAADGVAGPAFQELPGGQVVAEPGDFRFDVGDPLLDAAVDVYRGFGIVQAVSVHGIAKAPLADAASGVGTGAWDYGGGATLGLGGARNHLVADATYWVVGDMPDLPLENSLAYTVSAGRSYAGGRWTVMASVAGATSVVANADDPLSIGVGIGHAPRSTRGFGAGVSLGLSESSPDVTTYLGWRFALGGGE